MKKCMIITVGTGKSGADIAHAICLSIKQQNPDYVVFLKTRKSDKTTMPIIKQDPVLAERPYEEIEISRPDDVEKIASECQEAVKGLSKKGYKFHDMVADYTSGTKAMSAGLTIASIKCKVGTLVYVSGDRAEDGRVISGTERPTALQPNRMMADSLFEDAVGLFNIHQYDASRETLIKARTLLADSMFIEKVDFLETLSTAYMFWDKFSINGSFDLLNKIKENSFLAKWGISKQVKKNIQVLYQEKINTFCEERMVDLLENAKRRGDIEKKYDDAVARLYRLCEYIAQFHISQKDLYRKKDSEVDTSDLDISKLGPKLREKYKKHKDHEDGKVKLSLYASYELLSDLGELPGNYFFEDEKKSKKLLGLRNNSILAHGFNPISEKVYKEMLTFVEDFIKKTVGDFEYKKNRIQFPIIRMQT